LLPAFVLRIITCCVAITLSLEYIAAMKEYEFRFKLFY